MKEAFKFTKIDHSISKGQWKIFLMFIILAVVLSVTMDSSLFVPIYLAFGSVILSTSPFSLENSSLCSFVNLLPASTRSRVQGRFFFSTYYLGIGMVISELSAISKIVMGKTNDILLMLIFPVFIVAVSLIFVSIEYVLLYALGNTKGKQYMKLICMAPGFVLFFITSAFSDQIMGLAGAKQLLVTILFIGIIVGLLCYIAAIEISIMIVKKRDSI